jgi:hypothetical protein
MDHKPRRLIEIDGCIYDAAAFPLSHGFGHLDSVGREAFVNHIHLSGDAREQLADQIVQDWIKDMHSKWPNETFRVYRHVIDREIVLRFHLVRHGVANWFEGEEGLLVVEGIQR